MIQILLEVVTLNREIKENQQSMLEMNKNQQEMLAKLQEVHAVIAVNKAIPAQILLSKPIILLDARGRFCPFHIEFIDSFEVHMPASCSKNNGRREA